MPLLPYNPGYKVEGDQYRTNLKLFVSTDDVAFPEEFLHDPYLQVLFTNPFSGSYFRPAEVQITAGTFAAVRALNPGDLTTDLSVMKDFYTGKLKTVVTIANGGTQHTDPNSYIRYANYPIGIYQHNAYRHINDRFYGNYPTVVRRGVVELPYIANTTLGAAMKYGCVVSNGVSGSNRLHAGDFLMSDTHGKGVKWNGSSAQQIVGQIQAVDTSIPPTGWLQWVMWDLANLQFNATQKPMFNPYDISQPLPTPDTSQATFDPADLTASDFSKHFMPDVPDNYGYNSLYRWPEQLWDAMGIPGMTDGARMAAVDYTEAFVGGTIDATTNAATINLAHTRVPKDEQGAIAPTSDHPFPSKLLLYKNGSADPLSENIDYKVDRYRGIVVIASGTAGNLLNDPADTYSITYTSLEDQVIGVPTNWDFRGSIGVVRFVLKF